MSYALCFCNLNFTCKSSYFCQLCIYLFYQALQNVGKGEQR